MAGKFPSLGDFDIPSEVFDIHEWIADEFIDGEIGDECTLVFPNKQDECDNCIFDGATGRSSGMYKAGGPSSFPAYGICPRCNGRGRLTLPNTDSIKLRVYWRPQDWIDIGMRIVDATGVAMTIGYITDLPRLEQAKQIILHSDLQSLRRYFCEREGEAVPHGFQNRYFIQYMRRTGGG